MNFPPPYGGWTRGKPSSQGSEHEPVGGCLINQPSVTCRFAECDIARGEEPDAEPRSFAVPCATCSETALPATTLMRHREHVTRPYRAILRGWL